MLPVCLRSFVARTACRALLSMAAAALANANPIASLQRTNNDALVLLEVRLGDTRLTDALEAQEVNGEVYLPLQHLAAALSLAIQCDPAQATANGFVVVPARSFYLDARAGTVAVDGKTRNFDTSRIRIGPDDIYVAHELLTEWLPVDLQVDTSSLWLLVQPREALPLQARRQRERRAVELTGMQSHDEAALPVRAAPYAWIETPSVDQTLAAETHRSGGVAHTNTRLTTFAAADLLQLEAAAYISGEPGNGQPQARVTLARHDPGGELLGAAQARSFALGTVPISGVANVSKSSALGVGLSVSSYPLTRPERFDTQTLSGPLPPGWDVELYANDVLILWRQADASGIYDFRDLPLQFGRNDFRLVFRGPQGQFREQRQSFPVGDSLTPPGALYYRVAAHPWADTGVTALGQFDWGIGSRFSVAGGATWLDGGSVPYANVGTRAIVGGMFLTADVARSPTGDWSRELGVRARLGSVAMTVTHTQLDGFVSELNPAGSGIRARSLLRANGAVVVLGHRLPVDVELHRDERPGTDTFLASARVGALFGGIAVTNQLNWQSGEAGNELSGTLQLSRRFDRFGLRAQMTYDANTPGLLENLALTLDQRTASGWLLSLGADRSVARHESQVNISVNRSFEAFALGARGGWSSDGSLSLGMNMFMSLGREPRSGAWHMNPVPLAESGALSARVFLDSNLNGVFDAGETLLPGVAFQVNGGRQQARTGETGVALLEHLPVSQLVTVAVEPGTLEDPFWLPRPVGMRVVPRPGNVLVVDFPVIPTTEIDGTVYGVVGSGVTGGGADSSGERRALADRRIELRGSDGALIASTVSTGDGYYLLSAVPPGTWVLTVMAAAGEKAPPPRTVHVNADGRIDAIDLVLNLPGGEPRTSVASLAHGTSEKSRRASVPNAAAVIAHLDAAQLAALRSSGVFAVQAGAFMSTVNAEHYASVLKALGYTPRIRTYVDANSVRWYRVRFGGSNELVNALAAVEVLRTQVATEVIPVTERAGR